MLTMDTLQIDVKGWPETYVKLVKKYAEEVAAAALGKNGFPCVQEEELRRLSDEGVISRARAPLPDSLKTPPSDKSPAGALEALLHERDEGR